jgi:hypothetical protein
MVGATIGSFVKMASKHLQILLLLALAGCGCSSRVETARVSSPNNEFDAVVQRVDPGGGATVGYLFEVYVVASGDPATNDPVVTLSRFDSRSGTGVVVSWHSDSSLLVRHEPARVDSAVESMELRTREGELVRVAVQTSMNDPSRPLPDDWPEQ